MSEIEDRRQRARVRYYDNTSSRNAAEGSAVALESAIETATQIKITPDILKASGLSGSWWSTRDALARAFRAAGFEVIE